MTFTGITCPQRAPKLRTYPEPEGALLYIQATGRGLFKCDRPRVISNSMFVNVSSCWADISFCWALSSCFCAFASWVFVSASCICESASWVFVSASCFCESASWACSASNLDCLTQPDAKVRARTRAPRNFMSFIFELTGTHSQVHSPRTINEILADCYAQLRSHGERQEEEVFG